MLTGGYFFFLSSALQLENEGRWRRRRQRLRRWLVERETCLPHFASERCLIITYPNRGHRDCCIHTHTHMKLYLFRAVRLLLELLIYFFFPALLGHYKLVINQQLLCGFLQIWITGSQRLRQDNATQLHRRSPQFRQRRGVRLWW